MSASLSDRLRRAESNLTKIDGSLTSNPHLAIEVRDNLRKVTGFASEIQALIDLVGVRAAALQGLKTLTDGIPTGEDTVAFGGTRVKFRHARLLGVQAYLSTTWSLSDRITDAAGRVLCVPGTGFNLAHPAALVSEFVSQETMKRRTAGGMFETVQRIFGWPIAISYSLRNLFLHEGGQREGGDFFEGTSPSDLFKISERGWKWVEQDARSYEVNSTCRRADWPAPPREDLRVVLASCESEMDDALGILLGSACGMALLHVGHLVGDD